MAPHFSTLAWKIPWMEETGGLQSMVSLWVRHDWTPSLSLFTFMHWRRKWQHTPIFLLGESQGRGAWWAAVYGVAMSQTQLKQLSSSNHIPSNSTTRYIPKGSDNICPKENLYMNVYSSIIHYIQNIETTKCRSICNKNEYNKLWKILKEMGRPEHLTYLPRNLEAGQEARVEPNMEWTHSRLPGEISITSDMQMIPL